ncbi:hypothetical protein NL676_008810 [Syzygium grande]|nr:hypothetical protein NL676_008810 [Syzygium grande]
MAEAKKQTLGPPPNQMQDHREQKARVRSHSLSATGGMSRKACKLAIPCGTEAAIIAYLPRVNPFVFGQPSADAVMRLTCLYIEQCQENVVLISPT